MEDWKGKLESVIKKWDKGPPSHLLEERPSPLQKVPNNVLTVRPKRRTQNSFRKARNERAKEREYWLSLEQNSAKKKFKLIAPILKVPCEPYQMYQCHQCQKIYQGQPNLKSLSTPSSLINILDVTIHKHRNYFLGLLAPDVNFIFSRKMHSYPCQTVKKENIDWLSNTISQKSVNMDLREDVDSPQQILSSRDATSICKNMAYSISSTVLRLVSWRLLKFFRDIFSCICCQSKDIRVLQETEKGNTAIIYLPLHKSFLDYVVICFTLYCNNLKVPFTAIPDNLCRGRISRYILRKLGAVFVCENGKRISDEANHIMLQKNVEELLIKNQSIQIAVGSTDDFTSSVASTLLSVVTHAVAEGAVDDVIIVPVNVCYERQVKSIATWNIFKSLWFGFRSRLNGMVHVCFGVPFSLQDFCTREARFPSRNSDLPKESMPDYNGLYTATSTKEVTDSLTQHVVADCNRVVLFCCTSLVSFLLITKHKSGASIEALENSFEVLRNEIIDWKRYLAFDGLTSDVVSYSLRMLQNQGLIEMNTAAEGSNTLTTIKAIDCPERRQCLIDYSREVMMLYILKAIMASSIIGVCGGVDFIRTDQRLPESVSRIEVLSLAECLCQLATKEYAFIAPCCDIPSMLSDALDSLIASGLLVIVKDTTAIDTRNHFDFEEEYDDGVYNGWYETKTDVSYEVNLLDDRKDDILFLQSLVAPFLEAAWFVVVLCLIY
ncbi:glycerol-3-phosphate acyltransferase 1, mitochondrial-like isoform X2 [Rhopilema esculentum]|uniref:glycerol-3-phosphate acyltransferase 1, mitochondrial-like isoform X2 n=1 Tax=Rhopilema esculentum TaxID=499914 RepID=UPI0031D325D5